MPPSQGSARPLGCKSGVAVSLQAAPEPTSMPATGQGTLLRAEPELGYQLRSGRIQAALRRARRQHSSAGPARSFSGCRGALLNISTARGANPCQRVQVGIHSIKTMLPCSGLSKFFARGKNGSGVFFLVRKKVEARSQHFPRGAGV